MHEETNPQEIELGRDWPSKVKPIGSNLDAEQRVEEISYAISYNIKQRFTRSPRISGVVQCSLVGIPVLEELGICESYGCPE